MTPDELCQAYRDELRRLYGDQIADASRVYYGRGGWYYIGVARRLPDGSAYYGEQAPAYRRWYVQQLLANLREREPSERRL